MQDLNLVTMLPLKIILLAVKSVDYLMIIDPENKDKFVLKLTKIQLT